MQVWHLTIEDGIKDGIEQVGISRFNAVISLLPTFPKVRVGELYQNCCTRSIQVCTGKRCNFGSAHIPYIPCARGPYLFLGLVGVSNRALREVGKRWDPGVGVWLVWQWLLAEEVLSDFLP